MARAADFFFYNQWKQAIVAFAKPVLRGPFERSEITKDEFKQILKKTADKVIGSYRKEGVPPPANFEIVGNPEGCCRGCIVYSAV